jgi:sugar/nucleoside kinase (ribokinase family)
LQTLCTKIFADINIDEIFIHGTNEFVAQNDHEQHTITGEKISNPVTLTGAGDHFNAGYLLGKLQKFSLQKCLSYGYQTATFYIKTGKNISKDLLK